MENVSFFVLALLCFSVGCGSNGAEEACTPNDRTICKDGAVYWVDSCGNQGDKAGDCECGCNAEFTACKDPCDCTPSCEGKECGPDGCGGTCGTCAGATEYCSVNGQCVDDCLDRECGPSPNEGFDCGSCPGATEYCDADGQCVDDCLNRECGTSPNEGFDCGTCAGATEYCDADGQCVDLQWQNPPTDTLMTWGEAIDYCADLSLDGHDDWRLPSISELRSLVRGCAATETGGTCGVTDGCLSWDPCRDDSCDGCDGGQGPADGCYWPDEMEWCSGYWSSSPHEDGGSTAWSVDFNYARVLPGNDIAVLYVRCVRLGG